MKRFLSVCICFVLIAVSLCFETAALEDATVFYLDYGDVVIGDDEVKGYDIDGNLRDSLNFNGYTITQLDPAVPLARSVTVKSGEHNIELLNINIKRTKSLDFAVCVLKNASANITISGENHLHSGTYRAAVDIASSACATIEGDGVLYAESEMEAGIGGGNGKANGTLTINSGTIYATGGIDGYSAGIGGGTAGNGGNITINGGYIVATGGYCAAGIGGGNTRGGGNITINGGVITATGGEKAAGIGGGFVGEGGNIIINGGSVKATGGTGGADIGNGYNCATAFGGIKNSAGNNVSLVTKQMTGFYALYFNGITNAPIKQNHPDDDNLYFYTAPDSFLSAYMLNMECHFYAGSSLAEVQPYGETGKRVGNDIVVDSSAGVQATEGFTLDGTVLYHGATVADFYIQTYLRGDLDYDGVLDARDSVIARCISEGLIENPVSAEIADKTKDGAVDENDFTALENLGLRLPA